MFSMLRAWGKQFGSSERSLRRMFQFWSLLGPYLLIISLGAVMLHSSPSDLPLFLLGTIGVLCSYKWGFKGLILSIAALGLAYPLMHSGLWTLALSASLFFSFFLSALSSHENAAIERSFEISQKQLHEELIELRKRSKELDDKEGKIAALEKELSAIQMENQELKEAKKVKPVQLSFLPLEEMPFNRLHEEVLQMEYLNKQLRKQFDEKSEVLHLTRAELFKTETALLALEKKSEECLLEPCKEETHLLKQFRSIENEREKLEKEVAHLEEIVSTLLEKRG